MESVHFHEEVGFNLSLVEDVASIHSFEGQVLGDTSVNEYTDQSTICHHKLARIELLYVRMWTYMEQTCKLFMFLFLFIKVLPLL